MAQGGHGPCIAKPNYVRYIHELDGVGWAEGLLVVMAMGMSQLCIYSSYS
jgi:hypothetical protein